MHVAVRRMLLVACALLLIAAGDAPTGATLLRQGDDAYERREFAAALDAFTRAQPLVGEPGIAAFNRAAAHFRLSQFTDATDAYRQALADAELPDELRVRAWYDLGNSLLASAANRPGLEEAMAAYRDCLAARPDAELRVDVVHNLEIAGWRWLKAQPPESGNGNDPSSPNQPKTGKNEDNKTPAKKLTAAEKPGDKTQYTDQPPPSGLNGDKNAATIGQITVLPDTAERISLTPAEAARAVAREAERIAAELRRERAPRERPFAEGKDW